MTAQSVLRVGTSARTCCLIPWPIKKKLIGSIVFSKNYCQPALDHEVKRSRLALPRPQYSSSAFQKRSKTVYRHTLISEIVQIVLSYRITQYRFLDSPLLTHWVRTISIILPIIDVIRCKDNMLQEKCVQKLHDSMFYDGRQINFSCIFFYVQFPPFRPADPGSTPPLSRSSVH